MTLGLSEVARGGCSLGDEIERCGQLQVLDPRHPLEGTGVRAARSEEFGSVQANPVAVLRLRNCQGAVVGDRSSWTLMSQVDRCC